MTCCQSLNNFPNSLIAAPCFHEREQMSIFGKQFHAFDSLTTHHDDETPESLFEPLPLFNTSGGCCSSTTQPSSVSMSYSVQRVSPISSSIICKRYANESNLATVSAVNVKTCINEVLRGEVRMDEIRPSDVLFGRGKHERDHPGNLKMKALVQMYRQAYQSTSDRGKKYSITKKIVDVRKSEGDRFLKYNVPRQCWFVVADEDARQKVSHAMRDIELKQRKTLQRSKFTENWGCDTSSDLSSLQLPVMQVPIVFNDPEEVNLIIELFSGSP